MVVKVVVVCKGMLGMTIARSACQLGVPHSTVLLDGELKLEMDD